MRSFIDIHTHNFTSRYTELRAEGIHPYDAERRSIEELDLSGAQAIGEIGLDFVCGVELKAQERLFREQLKLAEEMGLAVVLHCVRAFEPMMKILEEYNLRGVIFHGFVGSPQQAQRARQRGYYLSFGFGSLRSPRSIEAMRQTPLEWLFLERDESPRAIEEIYQEAARIKGVSIESLINCIADNYKRIFG